MLTRADARFNEARALCAGSSTTPRKSAPTSSSFNEARALCAGSSGWPLRRTPPRASFNEARALCAGSWIDRREQYEERMASMRPAHCAREVASRADLIRVALFASMRPAHCAREVQAPVVRVADVSEASMRPAHCAREVLPSPCASIGCVWLQ